MSKEPYVKPELKSEILEPGALCSSGSPTDNKHPWLKCAPKPSCGFCCDE